jgi:hypothetical protein
VHGLFVSCSKIYIRLCFRCVFFELTTDYYTIVLIVDLLDSVRFRVLCGGSGLLISYYQSSTQRYVDRPIVQYRGLSEAIYVYLSSVLAGCFEYACQFVLHLSCVVI